MQDGNKVARVVAAIRRRFPDLGLARPCQIHSAMRGSRAVVQSGCGDLRQKQTILISVAR